VVYMASYAPLFANVDGWQWTPDMIWVNNLQTIGTPNYYVQKLFSLNKGTNVVPALMDGKAIEGEDSLYASAVIDKNTNDVIIKLVNASGKEQANNISIQGVKKLASTATVFTLHSDDVNDVNSFSAPQNVAPKEFSVAVKANKIAFTSLPYSLSVIRVKM
jgi:alpha-N-arabinofuranosidase